MEREKLAICGVVLGVGIALFLNQEDPSVYEGTYCQRPNDLSFITDVATISPDDSLVPPNSSGYTYMPDDQGVQYIPLDQFQDSNYYYGDQYPYEYTGGSYYNGSYYYSSPYPYQYYHPRRYLGHPRYNSYASRAVRPPFRPDYHSGNYGVQRAGGGARMSGGAPKGGHEGHGGGARASGGHSSGGHEGHGSGGGHSRSR
jgi:hypothetical protein